MNGTEEKVLVRVAKDIGEVKSDIRNICKDQAEMKTDMRDIKADVSVLQSSEQANRLALSQMRDGCDKRHKHDTDEVSAAREVRSRVKKLEDEVADISPRFEATETSVVQALSADETRKKSRDELFKRLVQIATILGALGGGALLGRLL